MVEALLQEILHEVKGTRSDVRALDERVGQLEKRMGHVEERVSNIEERLSNLEKDVSHVKERLSFLEKDMSHVKERLSFLEKDMSHVKERLSALEENMVNVKEQLSALEGNIVNVKERLANVETVTRILDEKADETKAISEAVRHGQEVLTAKYDALSLDIHELKGKATHLTTMLDDQVLPILRDHESGMQVLNNRVFKVESVLQRLVSP
jgi:chromosome segregation ATPase